MLAFPSEGSLATWTVYIILVSTLGCVNAEPAPNLRDVIDRDGVLSDLELSLQSNTEELVMGDQNKLQFEKISPKDMDPQLICNTWSSNGCCRTWILPTITFLLFDAILNSDHEWVDKIESAILNDHFCCPFVEFYASQGMCGSQCQLPAVPFLVRKHYTIVPVSTTKGILNQYIFTYRFLSNETSEKMTVAAIFHPFRGHDALSEVTISNISQKLSFITFNLYTLGYQEGNRKQISIRKIEPIMANFALGSIVSVSNSVTVYGSANGSIEVSSPYNRRVNRAQYSCQKSSLPVRRFIITNSQLDNVWIEAVREPETLDVDFVVRIAVKEEGSYGSYNCFLRLHAMSQSENQNETKKHVVLDTHYATIQIDPAPWKEQTLNLYGEVKKTYKLKQELNRQERLVQFSMDHSTKNYIHNMECQETLRKNYNYTVTCFDQLYLLKTLFWTIIVVVISISMAAIGVYICIEIVRSRTAIDIRREIISTLEDLKSNGVLGSRQCQYDVFLSYSSRDKEWVEEELLHKLEQSGYTVCYDQRHEDFPIGKPIVASIQNSILTSRKTVAVFSLDYLSSNWTRYEQIMVLTGIIERDIDYDSLVVLKYRPCEIPLPFRETRYNDWTNPKIRTMFPFFERLYAWLPFVLVRRFSVTLTDEDRKRLFWQGLLQNIGRPIKL